MIYELVGINVGHTILYYGIIGSEHPSVLATPTMSNWEPIRDMNVFYKRCDDIFHEEITKRIEDYVGKSEYTIVCLHGDKEEAEYLYQELFMRYLKWLKDGNNTPVF